MRVSCSSGFCLNTPANQGYPVKTPLLLSIAALAFAFGYRFYAKLLALGVFRLSEHYSPSVQGRSEPVAHRLLLAGHYAAGASALVLAGGLVASIWGWVPAFLWAVAGTAVAGGLYALGGLWLSARHPDHDPAQLAAILLDPRACEPLFALLLVLLVALNATVAALAGSLLATYPGAVLPFLASVAAAWLFGLYARERDSVELALLSAIALVALLAAVWLFGKVTLAFTGAFNLDVRGTTLLALTAAPAWTILIFVYVYSSLRVPIGRLSRPQGYLAALLGALLLAVFFASALFTSPPIAAPEFHRAANAPGAIPFLFVTLTSGALAGFYLLVANVVVTGQLEREADARVVGYGSALALGAAALSAIIAASIGFRSTEEWQAFYASWVGLADVQQLLTLYIDTVARTVAGLGLDAAFLRHLGAVTVIGLLVAALEAGLRAQRRLLVGFAQRHAFGRLGAERPMTLITLGLPALLALYLSQQSGAADWLRALGTLDQAAAAGGLLLLAAALKRAGLPAAAAAAPFLALLMLLAWALAAQMVEWVHHGHWLRAGLWGILLLAVSALAAAAWRVLRQRGRP